MVNRAGRVAYWTILTLGLALGAGTGRAAGADSSPPPAAEADRAVRSALKGGSFPWYDAATDGVKVVQLPREREPARPTPGGGRSGSSRGWLIGEAVVFALFVVLLAGLVGLAAWSWRRYEPGADAEPPAIRPAAGAVSEEALPEALRRVVATDDPWSEADRRRRAGDLAGAVTCLFAHQLLTLARLDLVRLAPGRTGRQLQRAVADPEFRALVLPTLRLFEAVYYGHHAPDPAAVEALWAHAEAFERRAAAGVGR